MPGAPALLRALSATPGTEHIARALLSERAEPAHLEKRTIISTAPYSCLTGTNCRRSVCARQVLESR